MIARYTRRVVLTRRSILLSIAILLSAGSSLAFPSVRAGPPICQAPTASICGSQGFQPNDPLYPNQWGLQDQDLIDAWQLTIGTKRIIVAVVDTGVMLNHPDLQPNLWAASGYSDVPDGSHGWNFINSNGDPSDLDGHGTEVAGIIAAVINNGIGIAGTAQEQIMAIKVCSVATTCVPSTVGAGIKWAADHGAKVINISLSGLVDNTDLHNDVTYAWNKGALLVAAAGNGVQNVVTYPGAYNEVIAVSALQQGDTLWPNSNYWSKVELSAPGVNVLTTCWPSTGDQPCSNQSYGAVSGTSYACAFVSGIAALGWDYNIQQRASVLSNQEVRDALDYYATFLGISSGSGPNGDVGSRWNSQYGYGKPNSYSLLTSMTNLQAYTLTAEWQFFGSSGVESSAKVWVSDKTTGTQVLNGAAVGNNGVIVYLKSAHQVGLYFNRDYYDGSNNVYVASVNGGGGAPSFSDTSDIACGTSFTFPAIPASNHAIYYVGLFGDPYSNINCS